jgi:hypothetical protein
LVQAALEAETTEAIGAAKSERSETRLSDRSVYYSRSLIIRVGTLRLCAAGLDTSVRPGFWTCPQQRSLTVRFEMRRRSLPLAAKKQKVVSSQSFVRRQISRLQFVSGENCRTCRDLTRVSLSA